MSRHFIGRMAYAIVVLLLISSLIVSLATALPLKAQTTPEDGTITFRQAVQNAGLDPDWVIKEMKKDKGNSWKSGVSLEDRVTLGDLSESGALDSLTLEKIGATTNTDPGAETLDRVSLVSSQNFATLEKADPALSTTKIKDIPVLTDAAQRRGIAVDPNQTLGSLPPDSPLLTTPIKDLGVDLSKYPVSSVPGATSTPLTGYPGANDTPMSQIPGLVGATLNSVVSSLIPGGPIATVDLPWSAKEAYRLNTITGSYREGFHVPCVQTSCAYIELTGNRTVKGRQWISGKSQKVKGGSGCLSAKEPTGRHPFGPAFKVVLTDTHEEKGTADFAAYFPLSLPCGHRLYILGPVPLFSVKEKEKLFIGFLEPSLPSVSDVGDSFVPSTSVTPGGSPTPKPTILSQPSASAPLPVNPSTPKVADAFSSYKGVEVASLQLALQKLDLNQGDYDSVGPYLCDPQGTCGRAVGKYGMPSNSPTLRSQVASAPDGNAFLGKVSNPKTPSTELTALLPTLVTPERQETIAMTDLKSLIDTAHASGFRDDRLIEKVATYHAGGVGSEVGDYSKNAVSLYHDIARVAPENNAYSTKSA